MMTFNLVRRTALAILILVTIVYAANNVWRRPPSQTIRPVKPNKLTEVLTSDRPPVKKMSVTTAEVRVNLEEAEKILKMNTIEKLTDPFALRINVRVTGGQKEVEEGPAEETNTGLKLEGIWVDSGVKMVFVSGLTLSEGQSVQGWQVKKIERTQVLLVKGEKSRMLKLEE